MTAAVSNLQKVYKTNSLLSYAAGSSSRGRKLIVAIAGIDASSSFPSSVTFGSDSMTRLANRAAVINGSDNYKIALYALNDPSGTQNISVTGGGEWDITAFVIDVVEDLDYVLGTTINQTQAATATIDTGDSAISYDRGARIGIAIGEHPYSGSTAYYSDAWEIIDESFDDFGDFATAHSSTDDFGDWTTSPASSEDYGEFDREAQSVVLFLGTSATGDGSDNVRVEVEATASSDHLLIVLEIKPLLHQFSGASVASGLFSQVAAAQGVNVLTGGTQFSAFNQEAAALNKYNGGISQSFGNYAAAAVGEYTNHPIVQSFGSYNQSASASLEFIGSAASSLGSFSQSAAAVEKFIGAAGSEFSAFSQSAEAVLEFSASGTSEMAPGLYQQSGDVLLVFDILGTSSFGSYEQAASASNFVALSGASVFSSFGQSLEASNTPSTAPSTRDLTSGFINEVNAEHMTCGILAKLEFDSGHTRVWTGLGPLSYNSEIYTGTGVLGYVDTITETQEIRAEGTKLGLTGVPSDMISIALNENYQRRPAHLWFAVLNTAGQIVNDPYKIYKGKMDIMTIARDGDTSTIELTLEDDLIDLSKPRERRYTPEDQKIDYPDDLGLDFVPSIQDLEVTWGAD